jgi:carbon monoxide dehydrogenase subunit G
MARVQVSIEIPRDVTTVWNDVERLETHSEWMADAAAIEFEGDLTRGVGVVMRVLTQVGPLRTTDVIRVTSWEPNRSIGVQHEGLVTGRGEFRLEPTATGTRFTWDEELRLPWYFGGPIGEVAAKPILTFVWKRNLRRLAARFD